MPEEKNEEEYYFITYSQEKEKIGEIIANEIINYHPLVFIEKWSDQDIILKVLFYKEITKEQYEKYKDNF